ncbi:MAG: AAA family ATPase [Microlunatus sp.]|nr:AAA family ATPase [Microlunatus sp.]
MTGTRVLITGLSGVGKSSVLDALAARGFRVADTDLDGLSRHDETGDWVWDLERVAEVLDAPDGVIFISGTSPNWRPLLPRFDHVVLLSAPAEVMITRLATRTTNPYGRTAAQRAEAVAYKETVEPLLRNLATIEVDTRAPLTEVVQIVLDHVGLITE